ncbi:hypothetical protein BGZ93_001268 [Podila epicladia]|nr:hypothetical protein BGZ92_003154 [Podila epicladia]KAG0084370.1 hypothetical protein BGZ93_001268 [Podila epicladia]
MESSVYTAPTSVPIPTPDATTKSAADDQLQLPTVALVESPPVLTETMLSSFSSDRSSSSAFGGGLLSTGFSTFSSSTSASRRSSMQFTRHVEVKETLDASLTENAEGDKQLKQYTLKRVIGQGAFGKVHLAEDECTKIFYAVKEFSKSKLRKKDKANLFKLGPRGRGRGRRGPEAPSPLSSESSPLDLIRGEVAILKKLNHINIVKLYEVLDVAQDDSMYMVFEFCERGALMPVSLTETYENVFSDDECRDVFQQMVLGIEYLHEHDIIHRDIKPDNLLRSQDGTLKIVDFGVSEMFNKKGDDLTKKSAGSPAFMAPELCRPDHGEVSGRATDIWSMGVTLYCVRYGHLPFISSNIIDLNRFIRDNDFEMPGEQDQRFMDLMKRLLEKDPAKRITIDELRNDPWLTNDGREPLLSKDENTKNTVTEITEEDLRGAIQKINGLVTVFKAIARFKRGIKTPSVKSSSSSTRESKDKDFLTPVTLAEKMQDADESSFPSITTSEVIVTEATMEASVTTHDMTKAEEIVAKELDQALAKVLIKDEEMKEEPEISMYEGQEKKNEEPEGYEMCDMDTGKCYWVSAKKLKGDFEDNIKPVETSISVEESKTLNPSSQEVTKEDKSEEAKSEEEPQGYQVCDMETGICRWVPANIDTEAPVVKVSEVDGVSSVETLVPLVVAEPPKSLAPSEISTIITNNSTFSIAETLNESFSSSRSNTASPEPSHSGHHSGSSSPSQSLTPGPRLIGKLCRDRLAMFERS